MSDERAAAVEPIAGALVAAVAKRDTYTIERLLTADGLDWMALCVLLADYASAAPEGAWLASVLSDVRNTDLSDEQIGARYGLTGPQIRRLCRDNGIRRDSTPDELSGGAWMTHRGIKVWVQERGVA